VIGLVADGGYMHEVEKRVKTRYYFKTPVHWGSMFKLRVSKDMVWRFMTGIVTGTSRVRNVVNSAIDNRIYWQESIW
jgi:hypothetical protein